MAGVMLAPYGFLGQNRPTYSPPFSISSKSTHFHSNSQLHALTVSAMAGNLSSSSSDMKASAPSKFVGGAPPYFRVKKLSENAVLPSRGSPLSAGYDLSSAAEIKVPARGKALIPTDLSIAVPEGTYARIGAGVIDADYRGAVGVILFNHSDVDFEVKVGDRIAQLIIQNIVTPEVEEVDDLDSTVRGSGGFGSIGV
nr:deoxyuridine 5'-triphosphate nucleotidohydrolase [Ipomoea batatas]